MYLSLTIGGELVCKREIGNPKDLLSVAVMKLIGGESTVISHVPRRYLHSAHFLLDEVVFYNVVLMKVGGTQQIFRKVVWRLEMG